MKPPKRLRFGDALAALGRRCGLTDKDLATLDQTRDRLPAEPPNLADAFSRPSQDSPNGTNPRYPTGE